MGQSIPELRRADGASPQGVSLHFPLAPADRPGEASRMARLACNASGVRHLRWRREIHATLDAALPQTTREPG